MAALYTDEQLIQVFHEAKIIFKEWKMLRTVDQVQYLLDEVGRSEIIRSYLNTLFKNLQTVSELDFGSTSYRKRIICYLNRRIRVAMTVRIDQVEAMSKEPQIGDLIYDRINANRIFTVLNRVLINGSKTPHEKTIGLSYAYSAMVEGAYKKSVQDCYVWERLGAGKLKPNTIASLLDMDVNKIVNYYDDNLIDKAIFEGYNDTVRNAVAHSTIYYNENTEKMLYKDRRSGEEVTLDRNQLHELYTKLWDVYFMVLAKNQLLRINDACVNFVERKASKRYP